MTKHNHLYITTNSYGSVIAAAVVTLATALAVLMLVTMIGNTQLPGDVPNCGADSVLGALTQQCERVSDTLER